MSKTYQTQLALCKCKTEAYSNIWKSNVWTITDYEELFEDISLGYVIQDPDNNYFILNPGKVKTTKKKKLLLDGRPTFSAPTAIPVIFVKLKILVIGLIVKMRSVKAVVINGNIMRAMSFTLKKDIIKKKKKNTTKIR